MKPSDLIGKAVDIARTWGTPSQWILMAIDGTTAHLRRAATRRGRDIIAELGDGVTAPRAVPEETQWRGVCILGAS